MVEAIITALSRIRWLFVIARNSRLTYKGQAVDVKQVGSELWVRYVLEGSVCKAGNRVHRQPHLGRPFRRHARRYIRVAGSGGIERRQCNRTAAADVGDRARCAQFLARRWT
jgi:hypothetical protein